MHSIRVKPNPIGVISILDFTICQIFRYAHLEMVKILLALLF